MDEAREFWIIGRALYEAVARLERLSDEQRPESDIDDMRELLAERYAGLVAGEAYRPPPELRSRPMTPNELSEILKRCGLSQARFARLCGSEPNNISRVVRGVRPLLKRYATLARIVDALHRRGRLARLLRDVGI